MKKLVLALLLFCSMQVFSKDIDIIKEIGFNPLNYSKTQLLQDTAKLNLKNFKIYQDTIMIFDFSKKLFGYKNNRIFISFINDSISTISIKVGCKNPKNIADLYVNLVNKNKYLKFIDYDNSVENTSIMMFESPNQLYSGSIYTDTYNVMFIISLHKL